MSYFIPSHEPDPARWMTQGKPELTIHLGLILVVYQ